jgi:segregation and condensation protein B
MISEGATPAKKLAQIARLIDTREVLQLLTMLNESYDRTRSAFRVEQTATGYVLMTRAALSPWLDRLHNRQAEMKLSAPMMESLTIIAYQQPVTRADVEAIRGVQSAEMIRQLMDRGLIRIAGEDDSLGRPFLYETTRQFLTMFGLRQLEDMPNFSSLRRKRNLPAIAELPFPEEDQDVA